MGLRLPIEAADYLGQCLEYCYQLTANDKNAPALTDWLVTRQATQVKIAAMNKTVWSDERVELKNTASDIWNQSVTAALATLKP